MPEINVSTCSLKYLMKQVLTLSLPIENNLNKISMSVKCIQLDLSCILLDRYKSENCKVLFTRFTINFIIIFNTQLNHYNCIYFARFDIFNR